MIATLTDTLRARESTSLLEADMATEFVRVPYCVEADGSKTHFLPGCRMPKGYRSGNNGDESLVTDYWEVLEAVMAMPTPTFRRANSAGNFGGVKCKNGQFDEFRRSELLQQIEDLAQSQ